MENSTIKIYRIGLNRPCTEILILTDYINIRLAAGLRQKSPEAASIGLRNGLFSVVVSQHKQGGILNDDDQALKPPSIVRLAPVTKAASGLAKYATIPAISSGRA